MLDPRTASFVLSVGSLEEQAIYELLRGERVASSDYDVVDLAPTGGWRRRPVLNVVEVQRLFGTVVLINCPDPDIAKSLEAGGRRVVSINHYRRHDGASWHGEACGRSSLEQVEDILGRQWAPPEPQKPDEDVPTRGEIIANARGGVAALARHLWRDAGKAEPPDCKAERRRNWSGQLDVDVEPANARQAEPAPEPPRETVPAWVDVYNRIGQRLWDVRACAAALAHRLEGAGGNGRMQAAPTRQEAFAAVRAGDIRVRAFTTGRHVEGDPELVLALAPEGYRLVLADAIVQWSAEDRFVPPTRAFDILALFVGDVDPSATPADAVPLRLELHAEAAHLPLIEELLKPESRGSLRAGCACGNERLTLRVELADETDAEQQQALSRFADRLLDELLVGNRPLAAWRTSFLQPLQIDKDPYRGFIETLRQDDGKRWRRVKFEPEETGYITPALRPFVVPDERSVLKKPEDARDEDWPYGVLLSFERTLPGVSLQVVRTDRDEPLEHEIVCVRLHFLANQVVLIEWTTEAAEERPDEDSKQGADEEARRIWRRYLGKDQRQRAAVACLAEAVDWNASARFIYSSFKVREADQQEEYEHFRLIRLIEIGTVSSWLNHGRDVSSDTPGHGHFFQGLLRALLGQALFDCLASRSDKPAYELLADDRSRVISSIVPRGGCPSAEATRAEVQALKARLHMVEPYGRKLPYDPAFSADEMKTGSYDRFASSGTWYGVSSHSFVCLSYGRFGRKVLHEHHMKTIYRRLFVLTLMQRAILHAYGIAIGEALQDWQPASGDLPREYQELRPAFLRFTNVLWLREVSTQLQGVELFRLMQDRAELAAEHARIAEEIEKTDAYWHDRREARRDDFVRRLTYFGVPFVVLNALLAWHSGDAPFGWWNSLLDSANLNGDGVAMGLAVGAWAMLVVWIGTKWLSCKGCWQCVVMLGALVAAATILFAADLRGAPPAEPRAMSCPAITQEEDGRPLTP